MSDTDTFSDQEIIAKTCYGEARGEGEIGMRAVACVIQNRLASGISWWGETLRAICLKPYQFSCWNIADPNRAKLLAVAGDDVQYEAALAIAGRALAHDLPDITNGADSYEVTGTKAYWALGLRPVAVIGRQSFYNTRIESL